VEAASRTLSKWKGRIRVQLANRFEHSAAPTLQAYDLQFEAYEMTALARADLAFVEWCGQADPTMGDIDNFLLTEAAQGVSSYSSALAEYVVGVLLKDRPSQRPSEIISNYRAKLNGSLRELQKFDRPLANLISCLIRLSSNDVARPIRPSEGALLNTSLNVLGKLSKGEIPDFSSIPARSRKGKVICPIDNGTSRVLERTKWLSLISRFSEDVVDQFKAELDIPSIDPLDKIKLAALWAGRALSLGLQTEAILPLRVLVGDAMFGFLAEKTLEKLDG
jgi:hypothetical protein